jgi:DUF2075 family protein
MIILGCTASDFLKFVDENTLTSKIEDNFILKLGKRPSPSERMSWSNSMQFMERVIRNSKVAGDCGVIVEYLIPGTNFRADFIITGKNELGQDNFIIVELKQWDKAFATEKKSIVSIGKGERTHPSYQVLSYKQMIEDMNEAVQSADIVGHACAYLHNYRESENEPLKESQYSEIVEKAPLFLQGDTIKLQNFIYTHVGRGEGMHLLSQIENGKIRPSKKLIEHVESLFDGNDAFTLLSEQKVAYENIIYYAKKQDKKRTIIVQGGAGTGKSVISMNALGTLLKSKLNVKFVAPNASFRDVMVEELIKRNSKSRMRIKTLFSGSSQFYNAPSNSIDVMIVDEAHRLKRKGAFQYKGENQVEDIIKTAKVSVFFVDDTQQIRPEDIGTVNEIKRVAEQLGSEIYEFKLDAQFRCSGAQGYINWLDDVFRIQATGNYNGWDKTAFEFEILDTPNEVYNKIKEKVDLGLNARMLAGYAWDWTSEKEGNPNGEVDDVLIPEHNFSMPWNGRSISTTWAVDDDGINQVGCVHTSQGLEFDYVGVIIGNDLKYDSATDELFTEYDEYKDKVGKKGLKNKEQELNLLVKQVYKVLLTRGMKGCYVFCRDLKLQEYLKTRLSLT